MGKLELFSLPLIPNEGCRLTSTSTEEGQRTSITGSRLNANLVLAIVIDRVVDRLRCRVL